MPLSLAPAMSSGCGCSALWINGCSALCMCSVFLGWGFSGSGSGGFRPWSVSLSLSAMHWCSGGYCILWMHNAPVDAIPLAAYCSLMPCALLGSKVSRHPRIWPGILASAAAAAFSRLCCNQLTGCLHWLFALASGFSMHWLFALASGFSMPMP